MVVTHDNYFYPTPGDVPDWAVPPINADDTTVTIAADPGKGKRRGFVIFFHETEGLDGQAYPPVVPSIAANFIATQEVANALAKQGWVTAYPNLPYDRSTGDVTSGSNLDLAANLVTNDPGNGVIWKIVAGLQFDYLQRFLLRKYGLNTAPFIVGGFSLGAHYAAAVAIERDGQIAGYFCHCLPTLFENLGLTPNPLESLDCTGIDLGPTDMDGLQAQGVIGWNVDDTTVGYQLPQSNVAGILANNPAITSYESTADEVGAGLGHLLLPADANFYGSWAASTFGSLPILF